ASDGVALRGILHGFLPDHCAGLLVEGDQACVEGADVDATFADRDAALYPAAADDDVGGGEVGAVFPDHFAAFQVDGKYVVGTGHHVDDAVDDQGITLGAVLGAATGIEVDVPVEFQLVDVVAVDR